MKKNEKNLGRIFGGFKKSRTFATAIERESNKTKNLMVR